MTKRTIALIALVVVEAGIIALLVANKTQLIIQPELSGVMAVRSPLDLALEYESPDEKFEKLVKANSGWIPYRSSESDLTILATCAILQNTNYVRILIAHGADVKEALKSLETAGASDAIQLLQGIANASGTK